MVERESDSDADDDERERTITGRWTVDREVSSPAFEVVLDTTDVVGHVGPAPSMQLPCFLSL